MSLLKNPNVPALEQVIKVAALSPVNKISGACFGALKMGYILSVVLVIVESYDEKKEWIKEEIKTESVLYNPIQSLGLYTIPGLNESQIFLQQLRNFC